MAFIYTRLKSTAELSGRKLLLAQRQDGKRFSTAAC